MPITVSELMATIGIDDSAFRAGLARAEQAMETFGNQLKAAGEGLSKVVTAPIVALAAAALKAGGDIDEAFDAIVIKTGATGQKLAGLQQSFRGVFGDVVQGAGEVGGALGTLSARTGLTGAALERLTTQSLNLSRLQGTDLTGTIGDVTRFFGDSSIATNQQSAAMDFLFRVSQKTGTTVDALTQKMVFYGAPLRQMGIGWQQAAILMGKWEKEGVNTELVMGSLRIALMKFSQQGIKDPAAALPLLIDKIKEAKTQGEATAIAMTYFGARAGADMAAAVREGRFAIGDLVDSLKQTGDGINETAAKTDDWREKMTKLWHEVIKTVEPVGTQLFNAITKFVDLVKGPLISGLTAAVKWWTALGPGVQVAIVAFAGIAAALGPVLFAVGSFVLAVAPLVPLLGTIATFLMGPWGIALIAATAALYLMTTKGARNMREWMNNIKEFFAWAKPFFINSWTAISDWMTGNWKAMNDILGGAIQVIVHTVTAIINIFKGDWAAAWDEIKLAFAALWDSLVDLVTEALPRIVKGIKNLIKGIWGAVSGGTKEQVQALSKQVAKDGVETISESLADQHLRKTVAQAGELLGVDFVGGLSDSIGKQSSKQTTAAINKILDQGIDKKKPKTPEQKELTKETNELAAAILSANTQIKELGDTGDKTAAKLFAHFHMLKRSAVEPLILAQKRLSAALRDMQARAAETQRWTNALADAKSKIIELKTAGMGIREALDFQYPMLAATEAGKKLLHGLAETLKVQKSLTEEAKKKRETDDKRESQVRSQRNAIADLHAEYLKLTKTSQDDQLSLARFGILYKDLDDGLKDLIKDEEYWLGLVKGEKDKATELKREKELTEEVTAAIARMTHELTLRSEAEEEGLGKKRGTTPFADLPEADQLKEVDEWMKIHHITVEKMTLADMSLARAELAVQHQLAAKKQTDQEAAEATRISTNLTEALTHKLAECNAELASIRGEAPKHSAQVVKLMADIKDGTIKLTEAQQRLFDAIVAAEDQAPIDKLTEDIKRKIGEVNVAYDQMSGHKHSAYVRLLEDLKAHGKLTAEQIKLLLELEKAEDRVTANSKRFDAMKRLADGTKQVMEGLFSDLIERGKISFKSIVQSFTLMLQKMAEEYLASEAIRLLFGAFGYDSSGVKIPHRAMGGSVDGGKTYMVGENGPELFRAPSYGTIVPNHQLAAAGGGGGNTVVHMTVHATDAQSFQLSNGQIADDLQRQLEMARRRSG